MLSLSSYDYHQIGGQMVALRVNNCHCFFFLEQSLESHCVYFMVDRKKADPSKKIKNICSSQYKCPICHQLLRPWGSETHHEGGTAEYPSCTDMGSNYGQQGNQSQVKAL